MHIRNTVSHLEQIRSKNDFHSFKQSSFHQKPQKYVNDGNFYTVCSFKAQTLYKIDSDIQ